MAGQPMYVQQPVTEEVLSNTTRTSTPNVARALATSSTPCIEIAIQPLATNVGNVYIGGAHVLSTGANGGLLLIPPAAGTQPVTLSISARNLTQVYFNPVNNGEGVSFLYW